MLFLALCDPDPCSVNGQCFDIGGLETCICNPGYTGNYCQSGK